MPTQEALFDVSPESREAEKTLDKEALKARVLHFIKDRGKKGITCDELESRLKMRHQTASARVTELKKEGLVIAIGRRPTRSGRMAAVLCAQECVA